MASLKRPEFKVLLTFDFDAESAQVRKTPHLPVTLSKGQFAPRVGVPRILDLLDEYRIEATFFTPSWTAQTYPKETKEIARRGHEVATHGFLHENFSELSNEQELKIHQDSIRIIEELTGKRPVGFRAPYWEWSTRTLAYLQQCGFGYDSSLMNDDKPYLLKVETNGVICELPVEWFLDDWTLFEVEHQSPTDVLDTWRNEFDAVYALGVGYFMLTMHPECIGRASRILLLKKLIEHISRKRDVTFVRCDRLVQQLTNPKIGQARKLNRVN
jgi:peptidoglycan/xylan/chitin deacetylase (PgdA/CDA1 family)